MSLSNAERQNLYNILEETGGSREVMLTDRVIPDEYKALLDTVERREEILSFLGLAPVRVVISRAADIQADAPLHVNMHGGGFIFVQDNDDDMYCAHIASACRGVVVDIDYASSRLHPYPMAPDQCYEVCKWAYGHAAEWGCSRERFSIGGASAGGNLSFGVAMRAKKSGDFNIALMILDYAANDLRVPSEIPDEPGKLRSYALSMLYADGDASKMNEVLASPVLASDSDLRGMPETLIISAKNCPFTPVNNEIGMRMVNLGTKVSFKCFLESAHGFTVRMGGEWQEAQKYIIDAINTHAAFCGTTK